MRKTQTPNSQAKKRKSTGARGKSTTCVRAHNDDPHVAKALAYIDDVLSGKLDACKFVKQACQRQLDDLKKFADHPVFFWSEDHAGRVCRFIERLPHVKGPKARAGNTAEGLIKLEGWQCFILTTVFGWRRRDTGGRRFRHSYIEVPRGNAKSTLSSGVGLYCMSADGEQGAEVYSAATKRDQAKVVHGDAAAMLRKRPDFAAKLGIVVNQHNLLQPKSNSKFEPLSRDYGTMDGLNVHCAIVDELHAHKDRGVYDVIETGTGKRNASILWSITTAGVDTAGICYEQRTYVVKLLNAVIEDESYFGIIYTVDEGDDWTDPDIWRKANPNFGVSVDPETVGNLFTKAMQLPAAQANFKTKHLNIWCQADSPWMDMSFWDACANAELHEEDFVDDSCYAGLDLATTTDIAAKVKLFARHEPIPEERRGKCHKCGGRAEEHSQATWPCREYEAPETELHVYAFLRSYLPEAAIVEGRNASYSGWAEEGWITTTSGNVLDFATVKYDLLRDRDTCRLQQVAYDPWQNVQMSQELSADAIVMVEVRATVQNFSPAMKSLESLIKAGLFHHNGNPVFRWMISNVVGHYDVKDNIYPRKERPENKIDGVVATIMALSRLLAEEAASPYTATRGFLTL